MPKYLSALNSQRTHIYWSIFAAVLVIVAVFATAMIVKAQQQQPPIPPQAQAAVRGTGTPNFIPLWITNFSLGNSPVKADTDGNIILAPGKKIFVLSSDGTKCVEIDGTPQIILHKIPSSCPVSF